MAQGETVAIVGALGQEEYHHLRAHRLLSVQRWINHHRRYRAEECVHALREQLALVLQDIFLFSDTVRANIVLGDEHILTVLLKAQAIGISEFIEELPEGLDYNVQERGGVRHQPRRLHALRACDQPKVLILDEATSVLIL